MRGVGEEGGVVMRMVMGLCEVMGEWKRGLVKIGVGSFERECVWWHHREGLEKREDC